MLEHVSLRCSDSKASRRFYERVLKPLGYVCARLPFPMKLGKGPAEVHLVCGFLGCDTRPFNPLLATLPRVLCASDCDGSPGGWLSRFMEVAEAEARNPRPGGEAVLAGLLATTHDGIAAVGARVGHASAAAFNRAFKKLVGVPPATWRRRRTGRPAPRPDPGAA